MSALYPALAYVTVPAMSRRPEAVLWSTTQRFGPVLRSLRKSGVDIGALLAEWGLSEAQVLDPSTRLSRDIVVHMTQKLATLVPDPELIGVNAATCFQLTDLGLLGYILRHSEHVLGALQRLARYSRLMADAAELQVSVKQGRVVFRLSIAGARPISPQGIDYALGTALVAARELTQPPIAPIAVRLARPAPRNGKPFRALFGARIEFEASCSEIVLDHRAALLPALMHDPQLLSILERQAQTALAELPGLDSFIEQVRELLAAGLATGTHRSEQLAASLGISVRTLRRRLEESGNSHRALLDQVRRERALELVAGGELSVIEIAHQVGFSDPSAFTTAFRRWTGRTPRAVRATSRGRG
jgi:AraC-like DNA-binding protein